MTTIMDQFEIETHMMKGKEKEVPMTFFVHRSLGLAQDKNVWGIFHIVSGTILSKLFMFPTIEDGAQFILDLYKNEDFDDTEQELNPELTAFILLTGMKNNCRGIKDDDDKVIKKIMIEQLESMVVGERE